MNAGERRALLHYLLRGYRLLEANAWAGGYEVDLVLRRGRTLVFAEVKQRAGPAFGGALGAVGPEKRRRVARAATAWLTHHPELHGLNVRLEVVAIQGSRLERRLIAAP